MADKGHQALAGTEEERRRETVSEGGHASDEKGAAHEFNANADASRKGLQARVAAHARGEGIEAGDEDSEMGRSDNGTTSESSVGLPQA